MVYDLIVIGGGPTGEKAAVAAAFFDKKVGLVERAAAGPGGAMVHTGTLPSKTLRETALYLTGSRSRELYDEFFQGIPDDRRNAKALMCRLPTVTGLQADQIEQNLERHGVELIAGEGVLVDVNHVRVGDRVLEAKNFLIATGSSPRRPAGFDFDDPEVHDSDSILELERLPKSFAIIGGGVIGSEYACVFSAFGCKIEVIEKRPRLMSFLDEAISDALMASMEKSGIALHLDDGVERVERVGDKLQLTLVSGKVMEVDQVMVSAGRVGNTSGLGLEAVGVALNDRKLVIVDEHLRTNVPNIYAGGDVIGRPALASTAMEQGRLAVAAMFGHEIPSRDFETIPAGIYTIPEACACGPTEQELVAKGVPVVTGTSYMRHNARGQIIGDTDGFVKLVFHRDTKALLGTHIICERATELIHVGQAVQRLGGGIDYFIEAVMSYPSLTVAYKYAAYDALGKLMGRTIHPLE